MFAGGLLAHVHGPDQVHGPAPDADPSDCRESGRSRTLAPQLTTLGDASDRDFQLQIQSHTQDPDQDPDLAAACWCLRVVNSGSSVSRSSRYSSSELMLLSVDTSALNVSRSCRSPAPPTPPTCSEEPAETPRGDSAPVPDNVPEA